MNKERGAFAKTSLKGASVQNYLDDSSEATDDEQGTSRLDRR